MNTIDDRIIEIEVTAEHVAEMRAGGVPENEIPPVGTIKRYRPARHRMSRKVPVLLDSDIVDHFKRQADAGDGELYQTQINDTLRQAIERQG